MSAVPIIVTAQAVQTRSRSANNRGGRTARGRDRLSMKAVDATGDQHVFDAADYERERLEKDAAAMDQMKQVASSAPDSAWKWPIRKRIWDLLEEKNLAAQPRPVHHRIPNFVTAAEAAKTVATLPEFQKARCVKVNPDTPQKHVRLLTLTGKKLLVTPQPRLRTGFFSAVDGALVTDPPTRAKCCTSAGVAQHGVPLDLDSDVKVDLVFVGSVAVDPVTGARLGKGEGFAELEYGMLRLMGAIDASTPVVTSVLDEQLVQDIPLDKMLLHDVPVDIICTPTQVIRVSDSPIPKPTGIYWELLSPQKLSQIKVLRILKKRLEEQLGAPLPSGPDEVLPPLAERSSFGSRGKGRGARKRGK
eukprot:CAMPEP_0114307340 /NCGR_PEP_ID=MMETSP0059-20121206/17415_1 /TAXON_ID=36894 /ORGANISM="Pyramimonas parkeae, Strain CCMP726" /LENGTH=359 /DNA_ID=CAMNT_0001430793 /DNA_START=139 /DNA_END=1215 /DNA_ORIENTATION=-